MIYLNGVFVSDDDGKIYSNDRGFLLSDGIFETMRAYDGVVANLTDHYDRLKKSADYLGIPLSITAQKLMEITKALLEKNALDEKNSSLRLTLTRGTGPRGLLPPANINPTLMITAFPFTGSIANHVKVIISNIRRNETSPLCNIKSLCYLDNIIAKRDAMAKGADDCLLLNTKGFLACGSIANIFIVTEKGILTPRIEDGALPGITRKALLNLSKSNGYPIFEESINESDVVKAKEVFFTNRLIEIQPVIQVNSNTINNGEVGEVTTALIKLYKDYIKTQVNHHLEKKNL